MTMQIERRFLKGGQLRARKDGAAGIEGVGAVYNQQYDSGWMIETIKPGAFTRALKEKQDVRCLFNHDPNNVLGRTKSGTLSISDASDGLHFSCDTDAATRIGADVRAMIDRGDVDGCSISFSVCSQVWREEKDDKGAYILYREIEDVDLYDVGPVTFPAYEQTSVSARSAAGSEARQKLRGLLWPAGVPEEIRSHVPELRGDGETKKVDGEELTRKCFLLVGDPDKTDTWELPWKFSTDEKTKSHLRDALARFNQVEGFSDEALDKAWKKLLMLCDHYDIDVADKTRPGSSKKSRRDMGDDECDCDCAPCQDGRCEDCSCGSDCDAENCSADDCMCANNRSRRALQLRARSTEVTL